MRGSYLTLIIIYSIEEILSFLRLLSFSSIGRDKKRKYERKNNVKGLINPRGYSLHGIPKGMNFMLIYSV